MATIDLYMVASHASNECRNEHIEEKSSGPDQAWLVASHKKKKKSQSRTKGLGNNVHFIACLRNCRRIQCAGRLEHTVRDTFRIGQKKSCAGWQQYCPPKEGSLASRGNLIYVA